MVPFSDKLKVSPTQHASSATVSSSVLTEFTSSVHPTTTTTSTVTGEGTKIVQSEVECILTLIGPEPFYVL